jgi:hypothetical protein
MASNNELIAQIKKLDAESDTEDLTNKELAELLAGLKAAPEDEPEDEPEAAPTAPVAPYSVKKGGAVTSKRGILADGQALSAADLAGGQSALDALVKSGHVVKA